MLVQQQQQRRSSLVGWVAAVVAVLAQVRVLFALLLMLRHGLAATWQMPTQQMLMLSQQMLTQ
jgi:hypothetical protein